MSPCLSPCSDCEQGTKELLLQIESIRDVSDLICFIREIFEDPPTDDQPHLFLRLLFAAIESNNFELFELLMADHFPTRMSSVQWECYMSSFELVIKLGRLDMFKQLFFDEAVTSCRDGTLYQKVMHDRSQLAMKYACIWNQPQIIKFLVLYDKGLKGKRFHDSSVRYHKTKTCGVTQLHNVISFAKKCFSGKLQFSLPDVVKQVIEFGGSVDALDCYGKTPLECLMDQILYCVRNGEKGQGMIVETTRILLDAGRNVTEKYYTKLIYNLLDECCDYTCGLDLCKFSIASGLREHFRVAVKLTDMLLQYGSDTMFFELVDIPKMLLNGAAAIVQLRERIIQLPGLDDPYDDILDCYAEAFRCVLLVSIKNFECKWWHWWGPHGIDQAFVKLFVYIGGYAAQPGRSKNLIHLMIRSLSVNDIRKLKRKLSKRIKSMPASKPAKLRTFTVEALEWIRRVETPLTLQELSRRAINRAMGRRSLNGVPDLEIPVHLKPYLLLQGI